MTESELEKLRLSCRAEAAEILLMTICDALAKLAPGVSQSLQQAGNQMRAQYSQMSFPGAAPEYSDLFAAEFQEAIDSLLGRLEMRLSRA